MPRCWFALVVGLAACGGSSSQPADAQLEDSGGGDSSDASGGDAGTGDECPAYQTRCNGVCIPTSVDPDNCGGCGVTCGQDQVCSGGSCTASCLAGLTACDRQCVDTASDNDHCGGCDRPCGPNMGCVAGDCQPSMGGTTAPMCAGGGPPIDLGDGQSSDCLGQTTFRWAICSCLDIGVSSTLQTDAYDSLTGPYVPGGPGGGIGMNRMFQASSATTVSGAMWASSPTGTGPSADLNVGMELHLGGPFSPKTTVVGGDAYIDGNVSTAATITFQKALYQPPGTTVSGDVTYVSRAEQPVDVPPPCECEPGQLLPIAAWVAARASSNDNAVIGLSPDALVNPDGPVRLDLPCGRYYLDGISGSQAITIVAHGRTALFIGGDVGLSRPLTIAVTPTGTLDVVIAGNLSNSAPFAIGSPNYPALSRFYIGGATGFRISSDSRLGAFFYAGYGQVGSSAPLEVYGGVFAGDFQNSGATKVHYDRAILDVGGTCDQPGCETCQDCGNQACNGGTCGPCTDDSQCCAPLQCDQSTGQCYAVIL